MDWLDPFDFAHAANRVRLENLSDESLALVAIAAVRIDIADSVVAPLYLLHCTL